MVRVATERDIPALVALVEENLDTLLPRSDVEFRELLETTYVYERGSEILGCSTLEVYSPKISEIRNVAVRAGHRGEGIGRLLIERAISEAKARNIRQILVVTSSPEYFEKLDFGPCLNEKYALFYRG